MESAEQPRHRPGSAALLTLSGVTAEGTLHSRRTSRAAGFGADPTVNPSFTFVRHDPPMPQATVELRSPARKAVAGARIPKATAGDEPGAGGGTEQGDTVTAASESARWSAEADGGCLVGCADASLLAGPSRPTRKGRTPHGERGTASPVLGEPTVG